MNNRLHVSQYAVNSLDIDVYDFTWYDNCMAINIDL